MRKHKIVKKRTKRFIRHQSDTQMRVGASWRKPRGIDSRVRRRFRDSGPMHANCGFGTNKKYRHVMPNGFLKFNVSNVNELEMLMMHNRKYCAEIRKNVGMMKRQAIVHRATELNIKVTNPHARLRTQEAE